MPETLIFGLDGALANARALRTVTWPEVLGPHVTEAGMDLHGQKLPDESEGEAVRNFLPDPSGPAVYERLDRWEVTS